MSTLRTFNLQNPDSGTVNIEMDQGGNTLMTGIATVRGAAHFTSTSGSDAVGIGTDITAYKLDVRVTGAEAGLRVYNPDTSSNASGIIRLGNDDNQNAAFLRLNGSNNTSAVGGAGSLVLGHGLSKDLHLSTAGVSRLRITSGGNVSIGSLTDDSIGSTTTLTIDRSSGNGQISFAANGTVRGRIFADNSTSDFRIGNPTSNDLMLYTNNLERLRITSGGLVGINCTPLAQLHVKTGTNQNIALSSMSSEASIEAYNDAGSANVPLRFRASAHKFFIGSTEGLRVHTNGLIGVGYDSPTAYGRMTVAMPSQSGGAAIQVANSSNGSGDGSTSNIVLRSVNNSGSNWAGAEYRASNHIFAIEGTEKLRINSDGRLLINATNNPTIGGQTPYLRVNGGYANLDGLRVRGLDTGNTIWKDGGDMAITVASAHSLYLKTNSATGLQVTSGGQVATPLQPRFWARRSTDQTGYDGRNVGGTWIKYDVEEYDIGGNFATSGSDQGRFIAPVDGLYLFHARCYKSTGTANWSQSWFDVDGSRKNGTDWVVDSSRHAESSVQIYLTAGQKIGFHPYNNASGNTILDSQNHTWFKGCLLG